MSPTSSGSQAGSRTVRTRSRAPWSRPDHPQPADARSTTAEVLGCPGEANSARHRCWRAGTFRTCPPAPEPLSRDQVLVLAIAVLASFVSFLDGTVVNVALPAIKRDLGGGWRRGGGWSKPTWSPSGALILVAGSLATRTGGSASFASGGIEVRNRLDRDPRGTTPVDSSWRALHRCRCACRPTPWPSSPRTSASGAGPCDGIWTAMTTGAMVAGP